MEKDKRPPTLDDGRDSDDDDQQVKQTSGNAGPSRRELLGSAAIGAALGALATAGLSPETLLAAPPPNVPPGPPQGKGQRIVLKGGVVLTMDPDGQDYAEADVLIEGSKIAAVGPNLGATGQVIDCTGMIVMPGFIDTHHHQYYTIQRAVIPDGVLAGNWPQESYQSVQNIWTTGRIGPANAPIWDLGRSPYDPEDCYISELVADWAAINGGVTTGIDTSQSSHTPEHTDAMIQGLMDSGRRSLYDYSPGRSDQPGYEYPGAIGNEDTGIGRLRKQWFSSDDQLVTLGAQFTEANLWPVARHYNAPIVVHRGVASQLLANPDMVGPDITVIHANGPAYTDQVWQIIEDKGVHISASGPIEMQMWHGTPAFQIALDRNILPSLSSDVDTNMTPDMFTMMRIAFCLQRMMVNPADSYAHAGKPLVNCRTVLKMATVAGAIAAGLSSKVGMLKVGMEADVIVLQARAINTHPMMNAPGSVVTMMDTSNVDTVIIGGQIKKRAGKLVGVNVEKLLKDVELAQERVLARIHGPALVGAIPDGNHSAPGYTPSLTGSCCLDEEPYPNATP
jgi:cytosine/adenosine deaminase-related metal-dependent hydrolase